MIKIINDDCLNALKELEDNSIDSIVTDPPYGISFMGKKWDYSVPSVSIWKECFRVLKPGGHLLSFSGSRTYHRMAVNVEDAGFEIRDQIMWVYGSGFPKSQNISIAIDKQLGMMQHRGKAHHAYATGKDFQGRNMDDSKGMPKHIPITEESKQYYGFGTNLKPAHEPIVMARKPISEKTIAKNVIAYGTGAINIDACRIGDEEIKTNAKVKGQSFNSINPVSGYIGCEESFHTGRWPANFIHDGLEEEWSKYFYCPKASKTDRNEGCEELELLNNMRVNAPRSNEDEKHNTLHQNNHPTVKPTDLMRYLCRLVTPKNGIVLDPFMGSGSTGKAAILEGFSFTGIELSEEYFNIAKTRIESLNERV